MASDRIQTKVSERKNLQTSQILIDNWKYWAALELVSQLKTKTTSKNLDIIRTLIKIDKNYYQKL